MLTWKQRNEEERFFSVRKWYWDADCKQHGVRTIADELTIDEAMRILKSAKITAFYPQFDLYEEHEESIGKIFCKDECGIRGLGEF